MSEPKLVESTEAGALCAYQFDSWRVRVILRDGEPWWVLADVCEALGLTNPTIVAERIHEEDKAKFDLGLPGQKPTIINEPGLYAAILRSNKPEAERFKYWITHDVLPSIRKTGSYSVAPSVPQTFAEALRLAADLEEKRAALEAQAAIDAPKVELAEAIGTSERTMSITDAAKVFQLHPKTEVFPYLRALGYLTLTDLPTQAAIDQGYLSLKQTKDRDGNIWPQAVVEVWQLETWREHVVPQIKRWVKTHEIPARQPEGVPA